MLIIELHKKREQVILKCIREDGSNTWAKLHQGTVYHDIAHIAIEEKLGLSNAFYGMLASGVAISDYELPDDQKPEILKGKNMPKEALITEHLVNLLTIANFNTADFNFITEVKVILEKNGLVFPSNLTQAKLQEITDYYQELITNWSRIPIGSYLEKHINL